MGTMKKINKFGVITCPSTYLGCNNITTFFFDPLPKGLFIYICVLCWSEIRLFVEIFNTSHKINTCKPNLNIYILGVGYGVRCRKKQAEKLKSRKMKDEG